MEKKIVILFEVHPIVTYARRYDFQTLIDSGYKVEVCDMSGVISELYSSGDCKLDDTENIKYFTFKDRETFKIYIKNLDKSVFIWSTFQLTTEYYWIFKAISEHQYGFICNVDYVFPRSASRKAEKEYWTALSWHRITNAILYRLPRKMIPIKKADAVITYGVNDVDRKLRNILYDDHTIVELTNTIDYNECVRALNSGNSGLVLPKDYIVFIDEYMPYHPDGQKLGLIINPELYYKEVETFLRRVSEKLNLPVVIAAHPKADYKKHNECYRGMQIIQFATAELIKNARLVITHLSIAIGMILVCRKPFMVITTDEIDSIIHSGGITADQERDIKRKIINISNQLQDDKLNEEIQESLCIGHEYFDEQISKYRLPLGHPNQELSFGDIMIKAMERVGNSEGEKI